MQITPDTTGNPPSSLFIYEHLFKFIDDVLFDFKPLNTCKDGNIVTSEDAITEDLSDYLDNKQEEMQQFHKPDKIVFKFTNQSLRKTDIGVKLGRKYNAHNRKPFCWIEAKRLPTPKEKDRDEREYVFVNQEKENGQKKFKGNGGIQRFKENKHAPNLPYSIMIGYIQEKDVDYWFDKINVWIQELITANSDFWTESDYLQKQEFGKCDRYLSIHNRKNDLTAITLHHFWLNLPING